jgi:hypothetical protein
MGNCGKDSPAVSIWTLTNKRRGGDDRLNEYRPRGVSLRQADGDGVTGRHSA